MSYSVPIVGLAVVVGLGSVVYRIAFVDRDNAETTTSINDTPSTLQLNESDIAQDTSAQSIRDVTPTTAIDDDVKDTLANIEQSTSSQTDHSEVKLAPSAEAIGFAQSIGHERMSDATILAHADALRGDPDKLSAVLDEFSAEINKSRLKELRLVLGQLDDPSLVGVAESMLYSGNPESTSEALKLLRDIGPNVPATQDVGVEILSSSQDPILLVGATNILAGGKTSDLSLNERVVSSLVSLVQHPDPSVRRASFSSLTRWSTDSSLTPTLLQGLADSDPTVRRNTAYGFIDYQNSDASVISALLNTAEDSSEMPITRSGALLALKSMPLDESQKARMQAAQAQQ